jgi:hypothetical protein
MELQSIILWVTKNLDMLNKIVCTEILLLVN